MPHAGGGIRRGSAGIAAGGAGVRPDGEQLAQGRTPHEHHDDTLTLTNDARPTRYGVAEDENGLPTIPQSITLAGVSERIGQIVATSIAEVPYIDVREYALADDSIRGYLVVIVPQSSRAPHQVMVGAWSAAISASMGAARREIGA